jgi:hypothetical protein
MVTSSPFSGQGNSVGAEIEALVIGVRARRAQGACRFVVVVVVIGRIRRRVWPVRRRIVGPVVAVIGIVAVIRIVNVGWPRAIPIRAVPPRIPAERPVRAPIAAPVRPSEAEAPTSPAPTAVPIATPPATPIASPTTTPTEARRSPGGSADDAGRASCRAKRAPTGIGSSSVVSYEARGFGNCGIASLT